MNVNKAIQVSLGNTLPGTEGLFCDLYLMTDAKLLFSAVRLYTTGYPP
jgi:hypothetical protein